jgi:hypothetical protein
VDSRARVNAAANIVNQLADMYSELIPSSAWVEVRQMTNDKADKFVSEAIAQYENADR